MLCYGCETPIPSGLTHCDPCFRKFDEKLEEVHEVKARKEVKTDDSREQNH